MSVGDHRFAAQASRLAWALACVGLVAGVITLGLFDRALNQIGAIRAEAAAVQNLTHRLLDAFDGRMRLLTARIEDQFDETEAAERDPVPSMAAPLRAALADAHELGGNSARVLAAWAPVQECAERLDDLCRRAAAWREAHGVASARVEQARAGADAALAALRAATISVPGDAAQLSAIKTELSDLAVLRDEMVYAQDADRLDDLRDNTLAPALGRLRAMLARYEASVPSPDSSGPSALDALETAVFGTGYAFDPARRSVRSGAGGLLELCRARLESQRAKHELSRGIEATITSSYELRTAFGAQAELALNGLSQRTHENLSIQWNRMLGVGTAAAGVFSVLVFRIGGRLRRIVGQVEQTNASLRIAQRKAEDANLAKGEFLANMSHEIRTPMSAILGYADLLLDPGQTPSDRSDCIATIRRNGEHLLTLINDVLDLSKIEAGRMSVESVECSPVQLVHEVISLMRMRASDKGLDLRAQCDPHIPGLVRSDPVRLRQILVNLVGNAIKFTHAGSVVVRATALAHVSSGDARLRFDIVDSGIGISAEEISRLFSPFSQADTSTTRKYGGTGLGLSISHKLAMLLGGGISVISEPGKGSTFMVEVAVRVAGESAIPLLLATPASPTSSLSSLTGLRVLLAEDGPDNQRLIAFHLRQAGATVDIAQNGRIAVDLAQPKDGSVSYHVILMDMQMPELDGYSAASFLRQRGCRTPIVALTAHATLEDRRRCLSAGCDDHASKPIGREDLVRLCRRWADRPAARAA